MEDADRTLKILKFPLNQVEIRQNCVELLLLQAVIVFLWAQTEMYKYAEGISSEASHWDDEESACPLSVFLNKPLVLLKTKLSKKFMKDKLPISGDKEMKNWISGEQKGRIDCF